MKEQAMSFGNREVKVVYPASYQEYQQALSAGFQVATTADQRREWGVDPHEALPVLSTDDAMRILFADPGDPVLDQLDPSLVPIEDDDIEMAVDANLSVKPGARAAVAGEAAQPGGGETAAAAAAAAGGGGSAPPAE